MKKANAALISLLNSGTQFYVCDLLTLTTVTGASTYFTSADVDLIVAGQTYGRSVLFQRGTIRTLIGVEVDTLELTFYADANSVIPAPPFFVALATGVFDGAEVELRRAFLTSWTSAGVVDALVSFGGRIADIECGRTQARVTVKSHLELLNSQLPRNVYQPGCVHTLYDRGCGLSKIAVASSVSSASTTSTINSQLSQAVGWFDLGTVTFLSGPNTGITRSVKSYALGQLQLSYPLPFAPLVGDTFNAYAGCDKQQRTCTTKFNNVSHFRGFPYIPIPESSL